MREDPATPTPWKPEPYVDRRERITFEDALAELTLNDLVLDRRSDGSWYVRGPDGSTWLDAATPALAIEEWAPEWRVLMPGMTPSVMSNIIEDETLNPWKRALVERAVCDFVISGDNEHDPERMLADIIAQECREALDPLISIEAQNLIDRGREQLRQLGEAVSDD